MIIYAAKSFANLSHFPEQLGFNFDAIESDDNRSGDFGKIGTANSLGHARDYILRGWFVFPLAPQSKEPVRGWGWTKSRVDEHLCEHYFAETNNNIGVTLGERSNGLVDIDLDWPEARAIGDDILSELPAFGHGQSPRSHRLLVCRDKTRVKKFELPSCKDPRFPDEHSLAVAELRGTGGYTMFPGSVHPSGELVCFEEPCPDVFPERTWEHLESCLGLLAFLAVVVRCYPSKGCRDEFCMALAGALLRAEVLDCDDRVHKVDEILELVARLAHDEEYRQREKAAGTWRKMQAGQPVTGFPKMIELMGLPEAPGAKLREWLRLGQEADGRPIIQIAAGNLASELDRAEVALQSARVPLFQRGRKLVRVIRCDTQSGGSSGIERQAGSLCIEDVEPYWLSEQLQKSALCRRNGKPAKPTHEFCNHLIIGRRGHWPWPVIKGVIEVPTLRRDWSILQGSGYDAGTGLFLDFGGAAFPKIPENPTREDAEDGLEKFIEVIRGFPFAPDDISEDWSPDVEQGRQPSSSRSVILSAWLTGLIRGSLRTAPLHAIDAPAMGTGKSKLADIISMILTGRCASVMSQGPTEEEMEKRLFAMLYAGDPVIVIDNIERPLEGAALCSTLTQETWKGRLLGKHEKVELPTASLFMATGNNLTVRGDLTRRVATSRLDARAERPDERIFDFDPVELARENRKELVVAGLTVLRAYVVAGHPLKGKISHVGSFEDWTVVREALVWLSQPDPAATRVQVLGDDPSRQELSNVMEAWGDYFGNKPMSLADVKKKVENAKQAGAASLDVLPIVALGNVLKEITGTDEINARALGHWFKRSTGVVVGGRRFERENRSGGDFRYRLLGGATGR